MDRAIEKKLWIPKRLVIISIIIVITTFLAYHMFSRSGTSRLRVDSDRITISQVEYGGFQEYYPFNGSVVPETSVFLDVEQGGRVEEIFVEGGQVVRKGDLILRFSNAALQRNSIDTETRLLENLDNLSNTQFNRAQSRLLLRDTLLDLEYRILDMEKKYERYKVLKGEGFLAVEQYETVRDELNYLRNKRDLLKERIRQEDLLSEKQIVQANKSIERINMSLEMLAETVESLDVSAPITGHLSRINAEIGQSIGPGQRIGQIDVLDSFKIYVDVDQYYLSRVALGTRGKFTLDGREYEAEVNRIYSEVVNNMFAVDMMFVGEQPQGIKRGQRLTVELSFSEKEEKLMVRKGGFYQQTGGRWVYIISGDGRTAKRVDIRLGRQNPRYVEIVEGLKDGDWVITSGYDAFRQNDILIFNDPIALNQKN